MSRDKPSPKTNKRRFFQLSLLSLLVLIGIVPALIFYVWRYPFQVEVETTDVSVLQFDSPFEDTPPATYRRELRTVRRSTPGKTVQDGETKVFDKQGNVLEIQQWNEGRLHGKQLYFDVEGHKLTEEHYRHGTLHGRVRRWSPNGELLSDCEYVEGKPYSGTVREQRYRWCHVVIEYSEGERVRQWTLGGDLTFEERFRDGVLVRQSTWTPDQKTELERINYRNGERHGKSLTGDREWKDGVAVGEWLFKRDGKEDLRIKFNNGEVVSINGNANKRQELPEPRTENERRIHAALNEGAALECDTATLDELVGFLSEVHDVPIVVDRRLLQDNPNRFGPFFSLALPGVSLRAALDILALDIDATWILNNETILLTTPEEMDARRELNKQLRIKWPDDERARAMQATLATTTKLDFDEAKLIQVVAYLISLHHAPIFVDHRELEKIGFDPATPISTNLRGLSLLSSLNLLLRDLGLALTYRYESLVITSEDSAKEWQDPTGVLALQPPADSKIQKAFDTTINFDLNKMPLATFCDHIHKQHQIDIRLDDRAAKKFRDYQITRHYFQMSLRSALGLIFNDAGATCTLDSDAVKVGVQ